jgi:hypothetical protein
MTAGPAIQGAAFPKASIQEGARGEPTATPIAIMSPAIAQPATAPQAAAIPGCHTRRRSDERGRRRRMARNAPVQAKTPRVKGSMSRATRVRKLGASKKEPPLITSVAYHLANAIPIAVAATRSRASARVSRRQETTGMISTLAMNALHLALSSDAIEKLSLDEFLLPRRIATSITPAYRTIKSPQRFSANFTSLMIAVLCCFHSVRVKSTRARTTREEMPQKLERVLETRAADVSLDSVESDVEVLDYNQRSW